MKAGNNVFCHAIEWPQVEANKLMWGSPMSHTLWKINMLVPWDSGSRHKTNMCCELWYTWSYLCTHISQRMRWRERERKGCPIGMIAICKLINNNRHFHMIVSKIVVCRLNMLIFVLIYSLILYLPCII